MINQQNLLDLQKIIFDNLDPLIQSDYCLLDVPNHENIGDQLIWAGELEYLSRLKYKMLYTANYQLCDLSKIPANSTILLHGGGNFGDVWRVFQNFRNKIVSSFPNNRIIVFPQTIHYSDESFIQKDAEIFNAHPDLTICVRDKYSYNTLTKYFKNNRILLVPDMAFCLDFSNQIKKQTTNKILYLKRTDKELNTNINALSQIENNNKVIESKDWPTFNLTDFEAKYKKIGSRVNGKLSKTFIKLPLIKNLVDPRYGLKRRNLLETYTQQGIDFINEYDELYTTRLHVYILSILLDKKVTMIDNSYGKNSRFYECWMNNFSNSALIK